MLASAASSAASVAQAVVYNVSGTPPPDAGQPFSEAFVSYSIEFSSFPDFAGNRSSPNTFSDTLLTNLGSIMGTKPHIRVGGNTQDYALWNASLPVALVGTYNASRSPDYPTTIHIGPSYFESYGTWAGVRFTHGFNMGGNNRPAEQWSTLLATVPLACAALGRDGRLGGWEYGNEPDLYSTSAQGPVRPPGWNEATWVSQWLNGTRTIKQLLREHCPDLASNASFLAPSFAGTNNHLKAPAAWAAGLDADADILAYSSHNYISGATSPGVTLQGTLLNHTNTIRSVSAHLTEYAKIFSSSSSSAAAPPPHVFGETNSLYNQGKPGLSNSFGAALWGVDFLLLCASRGIKRVHMHMGTDYRYASWQPVATGKTPRGTKAPYYGNVAAAAVLGDTAQHRVAVAEVPLAGDAREAAYAAYEDGRLARLAVLNLNTYNTTAGGTGLGLSDSRPPARPSRNYTFAVGGGAGTTARVLRLIANGSDAITGITWDGWSYNYELDRGRPVRLANVTVGEVAAVAGPEGHITVSVPDASAAVLCFLSCPETGTGAVSGSPTQTSGARRRARKRLFGYF